MRRLVEDYLSTGAQKLTPFSFRIEAATPLCVAPLPVIGWGMGK